MPKTLLFVYGTLKRGQQNNHLLAGAEFVRPARTMPVYRLYTIGWHPGLVVDRAHGVAVEGEIWAVEEQVLTQLDEFEGTPDYFRREFVAIADLVADVEAYLFNGPIPAGAATGECWPMKV